MKIKTNSSSKGWGQFFVFIIVALNHRRIEQIEIFLNIVSQKWKIVTRTHAHIQMIPSV